MYPYEGCNFLLYKRQEVTLLSPHKTQHTPTELSQNTAMFPSCKSSLLLLLYTGCFLLFSPLGAPRHGAAAVSFSFDFSNSSSYDRQVRFDGDGRVRDNLVDLTCKSFKEGDCMGRMLYDLPVPFHDNSTGEVASFATRFTFRIVLPPPGRTKGDGMAFFLARYPSALPKNSEGRGLGLMDRDMIPVYDPAWFVAVEFDTYNNSFDPHESLDHIGVDLGSLKSANTTSLPSFRLNGTMTAFINFTGSTRMLVARLHFDDHPSVPPVEVSARLPEAKSSSLPSEVAVGFSASTGADVELHQILSWSFSSTLDAKKTTSRGTILIAAASVLGTCVFLVVVWIILSRFMWKRRRSSLMAGAGPRQFRYRDLAHATDNFSEKRKLGEGAFGAVYLGKSFKVDHHGGQWQDVAIKEIFKGSTEGTKDFLAEVNTISKIKHKNLVSLEGWCCCNTGSWNLMCWCCLKQVDHKLFLVYELMPLGDLDHHLHKKATVLPWPARYKIATGIGSALVYLHHDCHPYILHRDIKPGNILLDDDYNPKLADFGLSRFANKNNATLVTNAVGTEAYMDPQCKKHGGVKFPCSTDVYSFGLVLVEIACARCKTREEVWELYRSNGGAVPMVDAAPNERLRGMVEAAVDERLRGMVEAVADVRLGGEFHREQMQRVLVVGLWCSLSEGAHRPSMRQALRTLEQDDTPLPNHASFFSGVVSV